MFVHRFRLPQYHSLSLILNKLFCCNMDQVVGRAHHSLSYYFSMSNMIKGWKQDREAKELLIVRIL